MSACLEIWQLQDIKRVRTSMRSCYNIRVRHVDLLCTLPTPQTILAAGSGRVLWWPISNCKFTKIFISRSSILIGV